MVLGVAVDADGDGDHQPAVGVDRRPVDRRAQRALAGDDADQPALVVDDRRELERRSAVSRSKAVTGVDAVGDA